jgi:hypothetical protein
MRQLSSDRFHVQNAWATTSPYGKPGYRLRASDVFVEQGPSMFTGIDPLSGQQVFGNATWITSLNNQLVLGDTPVLYLPKVSGPAEDPGIPIRSVTLSQDRIFGLQVNTVWDLRKLLGLPRQPGQPLGPAGGLPQSSRSGCRDSRGISRRKFSRRMAGWRDTLLSVRRRSR